MNGVTHLAFSALIVLCVYRALPDRLSDVHPFLAREIGAGNTRVPVLQVIRSMLCFSLAYIGHHFLDVMARFTYHPSISNWGDGSLQWAILNIAILTPSLLFWMLRRDRRYLWGLFGGILVDLWDWGLLRGFAGIFPEGILHTTTWPLDVLLAPLPDFRYEQWAIWIEVALMVLLLLSWWRLEKRWPLPQATRGVRIVPFVLAIAVGIVFCTVLSLILVPFYPW
ncbi:MAG: hypothetical protein Q6373_013955 [Candidatus Sigynarchaeota archaeon]